jgi:hypothetical protein
MLFRNVAKSIAAEAAPTISSKSIAAAFNSRMAGQARLQRSGNAGGVVETRALRPALCRRVFTPDALPQRGEEHRG